MMKGDNSANEVLGFPNRLKALYTNNLIFSAPQVNQRYA